MVPIGSEPLSTTNEESVHRDTNDTDPMGIIQSTDCETKTKVYSNHNLKDRNQGYFGGNEVYGR